MTPSPQRSERTEDLAVRERPIPFSGEMVRAILGGRKTKTRRVVKPQPASIDAPWPDDRSHITIADIAERTDYYVRCGWCPYGQPGNRLWVRETWQYADWTEEGEPFVAYRSDGRIECVEDIPEEWSERVFDTWADLSREENYKISNSASDRRWRSARFMPRWASRITLELTGVRVERLQKISEADAIAEGIGRDERFPSWPYLGAPHPIKEHPKLFPTARQAYADLWDSINAKRGYGWDVNPWVWVLDFQRVGAESPS